MSWCEKLVEDAPERKSLTTSFQYLVQGEDGKRFRTRSGDTVPLKSLLTEAQSRCLESLRARDSNLTDEELEVRRSSELH